MLNSHRSSRLFRSLSLGLLALALSRPAAGQQRAAAWAPADTLRADFAHPPVRARAVGPAPQRSAARATFVVEYDGFPVEAEAAFQRAVDIWSERVESPVPIRIRATWEAADEADILGLASPRIIANFELSPQVNTWYASALADAFAGRDQDPANPDITASFNSDFPNWYFGLDANPPSGDFDLVTVVLHELGHGLGFIGSMQRDDGVNPPQGSTECRGTSGEFCWGIVAGSGSRYPLVYDRFAERGDGTPLLDLANFSTPLADALTTGRAFFDGPTAQAQGGGLPELFTPASWQPGSSYSHLDEQAYPAGTLDALMTPNFARGEALHDPGPVLCGALRDMGWALTPACSLTVPLDDNALALSTSVEAGGVVLRFRLPAATGVTSGVLEVAELDDDGAVVSGTPLPALDPEAAGEYEVRVGDLGPGRYEFRLRLSGDDGFEFVSAPVSVTLERFSVYPNPFVGTATVQLILDEQQSGSVRVYDVRGRHVATLLEGGDLESVAFDGRGLAAGVYYVRVEGENFSETRAVTLLR